MIRVYHRTNAYYQPTVEETVAAWPDNFEAVADVDTDNLDVAWECTSQISFSRPWYNNDNGNVRLLAQNGARASMVGDVFVHLESGIHWLVALIGFDDLGITATK